MTGKEKLANSLSVDKIIELFFDDCPSDYGLKDIGRNVANCNEISCRVCWEQSLNERY